MDTSEVVNLLSSSNDMIMEHSSSHDIGHPTVPGSHDASHISPVTSGMHKTAKDPVDASSHDPTITTTIATVSHDSATVDAGSHDPTTITTTIATVSHDTATVDAGSHDPTSIASSTVTSCDASIRDLITTCSHDPSTTIPITSGSQSVKSSHDLTSASFHVKDTTPASIATGHEVSSTTVHVLSCYPCIL